MSRHRKVKALDYDDEYDDYYGAFEDDDDEDFNEDAFEAQYLSKGIDLSINESNNTSNTNKSKQQISTPNLDKTDLSSVDNNATTYPTNNSFLDLKTTPKLSNENSFLDESAIDLSQNSSPTIHKNIVVDSLSSDLTKLAIKHLDKHQWGLPLMEMDKKFRDKTYYKHYSDTYISSLRSKLGHFLADNQLLSNPMKYHRQQELDNYSKYSRMFELLTEYYQSSGNGFFSFATPSPDEEIVIGCRLGTKAVKKQIPKPDDKNCDLQKTPRFDYQGKQSTNSSSSVKQQQASSSKNKDDDNKKATNNQQQSKITKNLSKKDITIRENHTSEQLDRLATAYKESLKVVNNTVNLSTGKSKSSREVDKSKNTRPITGNVSNKAETKKTKQSQQQPKQLDTLTEKRQKLQKHLKRSAEPSEKDLENFKKQAEKTAVEYNQLIKSSRPRVNLIVVGHVDAGKSTLVGHLLYKLGQISGKQMHRFEVDSQRQGKASFKFAWAMDETAEERDRGVTIDLALTQFTTANRDIVLLDAPGHVDFIPAVISGAAQADAALLVIDATRGEFETGFTTGGQTREHTFLARSLGVKSLVVVINKMDNVGWNWLRFSEIVEQLKPFLKQVGYNLKDDVQFVVASGLTGENLTERRIDKAKKASSHPQLEGGGGNWDSVPSLLEAIDKIKEPERMIEKPLRVCITDVFKGMSSGVFLGGKVVSGKLEVKQQLVLLPPNETCLIKQVEAKDGNVNKLNRAFAGDIVTTVATGIDLNKYYRGCMLCDPLIPCHVTNRFQARIIMFQSINTILIKGAPIEVHINGTYESGIVRKLISLLNKNTGELIQRKPRCVAKNSSAIIQLRLERVVCCELYENNKDLGRFMMRSYGKTIAAGLITKIKSAKKEKSKTKMKSK